MPDIIQDTEPTLTPSVSEPAPPPPADDAPLSEHIEQFHAQESQPEPTPSRTKRHRSEKNLARPEDVPRIRELTKELNEWKAKYEAATTSKPEPEVRPYTPPEPAQASTFGDPEPVLDTFMQEADPYTAYMRALTRWELKRDKFEDSQKAVTEKQTAAQKAFEAAAQHRAQSYTTRLQSYVAEHPERQATFAAIPSDVNNPLVVETLWSLEDGPDVLYSLLQQPALFNELLFLTDGKPVSDGHVARTTQWLRARLQAGVTGAAVRESPPPSPAPRPPTPVRTRPMPSVDGAPSDGSSLAEHQRYFKTAR